MKTHKSRLSVLEGKLCTVLRRETTDIIEAGKLLLEIKSELNHGEWLPWLREHFDLSERTARNYMTVAEYVAGKSATVADFINLAPGILHDLAAGAFTEQQEAAILAATHEGRIDEGRVGEICYEPDPPAPPPKEGPQDGDDDDDVGTPTTDDDIEKILGDPPPDVPPPAPITSPNVMLPVFEQAVGQLKLAMTKPALQFISTAHSDDDLEQVERFIHTVKRLKQFKAH
jgi:hypothetical protein